MNLVPVLLFFRTWHQESDSTQHCKSYKSRVPKNYQTKHLPWASLLQLWEQSVIHNQQCRMLFGLKVTLCFRRYLPTSNTIDELKKVCCNSSIKYSSYNFKDRLKTCRKTQTNLLLIYILWVGCFFANIVQLTSKYDMIWNIAE